MIKLVLATVVLYIANTYPQKPKDNNNSTNKIPVIQIYKMILKLVLSSR